MNGKRLLIVDDEDDLRSLLKEIFTGEGAQVVEATNGQEALDAAQAGSFDLIMLDVMMPLVDGYHVASELTAKLGPGCPLILIMTSRDLRTEGAVASMTGAHATIQKPFSALEILQKVQEMLG